MTDTTANSPAHSGDVGAGAPTFAEALRVWTRIGLLSFGGPAGQIALMHRTLVEEKKWIDEQRYLSALNFCMLLPGPEAMQLATYVGWRLHGLKGGLAAGLLFVLPGALVVLTLSMLYAAFGKLPLAEALFLGVKAAVLAIVVEALLRVARRSLKGSIEWAIAAAAFIAIFSLKVPFPLIVAAAALVGFWRGGSQAMSTPAAAAPVAVSPIATLRTVAIWLVIWVVPLLLVAATFGRGHVLTEIGWFFSKLAVVTFGGAYAVLAYMAQDVVEHYRWLTPGEMLDGLGLAETTPGPLILVTEFVGFLAAFREGGGNPWAMGVLGAVVTLWATFAPCFLWIFAGAPYIERLNAEPQIAVGAGSGDGGCRGRDPEPHGVVRAAGAVRPGRRVALRSRARHGARSGQPERQGAATVGAGGRAAVRAAPGRRDDARDLQRHRARLARARLVVRTHTPR